MAKGAHVYERTDTLLGNGRERQWVNGRMEYYVAGIPNEGKDMKNAYKLNYMMNYDRNAYTYITASTKRNICRMCEWWWTAHIRHIYCSRYTIFSKKFQHEKPLGGISEMRKVSIGLFPETNHHIRVSEWQLHQPIGDAIPSCLLPAACCVPMNEYTSRTHRIVASDCSSLRLVVNGCCGSSTKRIRRMHTYLKRQFYVLN